jgi:branched-chain amino acid transport system ATP-binding protein
MSAAETQATIRLLKRIALERGLTLLFTEHDMQVVFSIAQKIAVMHQGRMIAEGDPEAVQKNAEVRRVYLGERS